MDTTKKLTVSHDIDDKTSISNTIIVDKDNNLDPLNLSIHHDINKDDSLDATIDKDNATITATIKI